MADLPRRTDASTAEAGRLAEDARRERNWKRWGPYLAERQWATVREDYSADGQSWEYFPHEHARSRAYRWGEDGLLGICDREGRLCFALALWNERDPILKERLFGLTGPEGNHGEDVKESYWYLDATPTSSYVKSLYRYPQAEYPYARLLDENRRRSRSERELELLDTGLFDDDRYFDVVAEYAKASPDDVLIRVTVTNHGPDAAPLHVLPTLWFRNSWSWGRSGEGYWPKPQIVRAADDLLAAEHASLGRFVLALEPGPDGTMPDLLFTDNETNAARLFDATNTSPFVKDAFHEHVVHARPGVVNPEAIGTKAAAHYRLQVPPRASVSLRLRLTAAADAPRQAFGRGFDRVFADRIAEADAFYAGHVAPETTPEERAVVRQAYANILFSKQFYHYDVRTWLAGDPAQPAPPANRRNGRNADWHHFYARDVISMCDKWEYPWFAAWDLAFHLLPLATVDPGFAKEQLVLFLREWYTHPNGQIPAYEFNFGDVNPPVQAWAAWRIYKTTGPRGSRDRYFLARVFQKLLINFTWWVNRKDTQGNHLFSGGFLGLDNIGVFDRSQPLPTGGFLEQADATAWMAFYCTTMLGIALELAHTEPAYEDVASKFLEHFVAIADAINSVGGTGLWDEQDGFYYDQLHVGGASTPLRIRSMVGLLPLLAVESLEEHTLERLPGFKRRLNWFIANRPDLSQRIACLATPGGHDHRLLALLSRERLERVLRYLLDENEFLSPYGIRSLSRVHRDAPYVFRAGGQEHRVAYVPGESDSGLFGGNSNWRGPIWFPVNYLLVEALERYYHFYGDDLRVECPTGSGRMMNLAEVAKDISRRLAGIFLPDADGRRPCHGDDRRFATDPAWRDLARFYEYFDGDTGRGLGAGCQGWTTLALRCIEDTARARAAGVDERRAAP